MTTTTPNTERRSAGSMPDDSGNGTPKQKLKEDARDAKREVNAKAREQVETGQHQLAEGADALSEAIDAAASKLDDQDREGLARYARELSSNLASAAGQLEGRSVDELTNDAKRLARNNPALFMLGSIAVGFGLSRFFKASTQHDHETDDQAQESNAYQTHDSSGALNATTGTPAQRHEPNPTKTYAASTAPGSDGGSKML